MTEKATDRSDFRKARSDHLVSEADAEDGVVGQQGGDRLVNIRQRCGIAGAARRSSIVKASHSSRLKDMSRHSIPISSKNSEVPLIRPLTKLSSKTPKPPAACANSKNSAERREEVSETERELGGSSPTAARAGATASRISVRLRNMLSNLL